MVLSEPIESLQNTSRVTFRRLKALGINTYFDLLNIFPYRYENYSVISPISRLQEGEHVTIKGKILKSQSVYTRTGLQIQKFEMEDESGQIELDWYNQPYLIKLLRHESLVSVSGEVKKIGNRKIMQPREYELLYSFNDRTKHTGRIIPIYSEKMGLSSKTIREKIYCVLPLINSSSLSEYLPPEIISYNSLIELSTAYKSIHYPDTEVDMNSARIRIGFDELFLLQLSSRLIRMQWERETVGTQFMINKEIQKKLSIFVRQLPFTLTASQKQSIDKILADMQQKKPMNRFLQGEVGSGKTVVAAIACYCSYLNKAKSLFMAPTEILAEQHYETFKRIFQKNKEINISLITGSKKPSLSELDNTDIIIGTQALIQKQRNFKKVALVIIDEQHRFGVTQRAELTNKGLNPHLLTMTATPIPRTVMLTLYGELDLTVLDEMPAGRLPIKTYIVPKNKRQDCYKWVKNQIDSNHSQAYIVCPLIEESENETLKSVKAAKKEFENLKNLTFSSYSLWLLHGKLRSKEKSRIMQDFKENRYSILVTTPVVEVGIDNPNATIMIIEAAERFGLAQLHQLRGRIGRGKEQSYCFVFSDYEDSSILDRLRYFSANNKGEDLAEKDLVNRGPGNLYGVEQHGYFDLKIASLSDYTTIEKARNAANYYLKHYNLESNTELKKRVNSLQIRNIAKD